MWCADHKACLFSNLAKFPPTRFDFLSRQVPGWLLVQTHTSSWVISLVLCITWVTFSPCISKINLKQCSSWLYYTDIYTCMYQTASTYWNTLTYKHFLKLVNTQIMWWLFLCLSMTQNFREKKTVFPRIYIFLNSGWWPIWTKLHFFLFFWIFSLPTVHTIRAYPKTKMNNMNIGQTDGRWFWFRWNIRSPPKTLLTWSTLWHAVGQGFLWRCLKLAP